MPGSALRVLLDFGSSDVLEAEPTCRHFSTVKGKIN